jgi:predicted nucleotidyltransferase
VRALELDAARLAEHRGTHATLDELGEQRRYEDLAADGLAGDARCEDDVLAVDVVTVLDLWDPRISSVSTGVKRPPCGAQKLHPYL